MAIFVLHDAVQKHNAGHMAHSLGILHSMNTGQTIARLRRRPKHCLYCTDPATSPEHVVQAAIGGRLAAPILCTRHNNQIGVRTDAALFESLRPLVNMLRIKRQDGRIGAEFEAATETGKVVTVTADHTHIVPLEVERDERKRIVEGTGPLDLLDHLRAAGALADDSSDAVIATIVKPPKVSFSVCKDDQSDKAALKTALHFVAGFVDDVPLEHAQRLLPFILGEDTNIEPFVGAAPFNDIITPASWPPHHQVTCWTGAEATFVAVMLFDAHTYLCRMPFRARHTGTLRYRQPLLGVTDPILEENIVVNHVEWNVPATHSPPQAWRDEVLRRLNRIGEYAQAQVVIEQAERVGRRAERKSAGCGDFWDHYRAELQMEALPSDEIDRMIRAERAARAQGREVWQFYVGFARADTPATR